MRAYLGAVARQHRVEGLMAIDPDRAELWRGGKNARLAAMAAGRRTKRVGDYRGDCLSATSAGSARYRSGKRRFKPSIFGRSLMTM